MVIDCFTYNGEKDVLDIRCNILDPYVDKFIICEAKTTFTGNKKPLYFSLHEKLFEKWWPKIEYFIIDETYSKEEKKLAENSPNTKGATHWKREFLQKESLKKALEKYAKDDDILYIGDVDEIWQPYAGPMPAKLKHTVYAYYLNNKSNEQFWGTYVTTWKDLKNKTLNHERTRTDIRTEKTYGWHFTSMGGIKQVRRKLNDSYTSESYNTADVQNLLADRVTQGIDYLGRPFHFEITTKEWPTYLKKSRLKYYDLLKHEPFT